VAERSNKHTHFKPQNNLIFHKISINSL